MINAAGFKRMLGGPNTRDSEAHCIDMISSQARRHSGQIAAPLRTTTPATIPDLLRQNPQTLIRAVSNGGADRQARTAADRRGKTRHARITNANVAASHNLLKLVEAAAAEIAGVDGRFGRLSDFHNPYLNLVTDPEVRTKPLELLVVRRRRVNRHSIDVAASKVLRKDRNSSYLVVRVAIRLAVDTYLKCHHS
jgi:hypothetical protein